MKKLILISTAVLAQTVAHGQTAMYHPFPDSNAVWINVNSYSNPPNTYIYWYCLKGDTIINSTTYHKLNICDSNQVTLAVQGGIRQDTATKRIYFICFNANYQTWATMSCWNYNSEQLLYDFNAGVGDTLFYSVYNTVDIVISIDSIQLLDGTYRKQYHVWNTSYSFDWPIIEGIGSEAQLIWGGYMTGGDDMYGLSCFKKGNNFLYSSPPWSMCPVPTALKEIYSAKRLISITPNPFCSQTVLQSDNLLYNATLAVDNCFGQTVAQIKNISGQTVFFSRDNLTSGLYFVRLTEENKLIAVDKLVITDK